MTLTEIIAGLVVLAVLVSTVTMARGRLLRQWAQADCELAANRAVDRMLATWLPGGVEGDAIPVPAGGDLEGVEGVQWRTRWASDPAAPKLNCGVVQLEVHERGRRILSLELLKRLPVRKAGQP